MFASWRFGRALQALTHSEHSVIRDYAKAAWPEKSVAVSEAPP